MDISLAKSIYKRAIATKNNKSATEAEKVSNYYTAFQIENPNLPYVAPFYALNYSGNKIELLDSEGENTINNIIDALQPFVPKFNEDEYITAKVTMISGAFKEPIVIKFHDNKKLSSLLDTFLKDTNFRETEWIEFKTNFFEQGIDYIGRIFSGLSNAACLKGVQYAYLIYGVNELKKEISGTKFVAKSKVWQIIEKQLHKNFAPSLNFEIIEFDYNNNPQQHIIIFKIQAANVKPIAYCGKSFIRQRDKTIPLEDFPNLLKILSSPKQQPIINNSITIIRQIPQSFTKIDSKRENPEPQSSKKIENTDNKSKELDIKWIITIIVAILSIPFSGFAIRSCGEDEGISSPLNIQNNHSDQLQQIIINGNNNTISNSNNSQINNNNQLKKSSVESASQNSVSDSAINELCLLHNRANAIKTDHFHTAGLLTALMDDFNAFARKNYLNEVKPCEKINKEADRINKCGVDRLEKIKHRLNVFKMNHKINCNF